MKRILIGCPVMEKYEGCMERWLGAIGAFEDWGDKDIILADTGEDTEFCERWQDRVDIRYLGVGEETPFRRIALGM